MVVFADPVPTDVARGLDLAGYSWKGVTDAHEAADHEPADGWAGAIVDVTAASELSLIHISEPTRPVGISRMPSSA